MPQALMLLQHEHYSQGRIGGSPSFVLPYPPRACPLILG
jgi:hypothetical protein